MTVLTVYASGYASDIGGDWTNPTNVYSDNTTYATRAGTVKNTVYGQLYSFNLSSLPDAATLNSVTLKAEWHNSAADTSGPVLSLGSKYNNNLDTPTEDTTGQTGDEVLSHTVTGRTVAELKSTGGTGFWAVLRFKRTDNTAHTASCDYVRIEIDYSVDYKLQTTAGSFTWTRNDAILTYIRKLILQTTAGSFSWTRNDAFALYNRLTKTTAGSFIWTGNNAILTVETPALAYVLQTLVGEFAWTRNDARLFLTRQLRTSPGTFTLTGNDARLYRVLKLQITPGAFTWSGNNARLLTARQLRTTSGSFIWTGNNAIELRTRLLKITPGGFTLTGNNAIELWKHLVKTTTGTFIWTGLDAILTRVVVGQYFLYTTPGSFSLAGSEKLLVDRKTFTTPGVFTLGSSGEKLLYGRSILSTPGQFIWTGNDAILNWIRILKLLTEPGQFNLTMRDAILAIGSAITIYGSIMARDRNYQTAEGSDFLSMTATGSDYGE